MSFKAIDTLTEKEYVWAYPRPPAVEEAPFRIRMVFNGELIVNSMNAKCVIETNHPPVYYIPLQDVRQGVLGLSPGRSWSEWKGTASFYDVVVGDKVAKKAAWYYPNPTSEYSDIQDLVAFHPQKMDGCYIGEEPVDAQLGSFYRGWASSNLLVPFNGGPGSRGWKGNEKLA